MSYLSDEKQSKMHTLKTEQPYFNQLWNGLKKFEVRKNDRDYKLNDLLLLQEYDLEDHSSSGKEILVKVTCIMDDERYCKKGFVIMGIKELDRHVPMTMR